MITKQRIRLPNECGVKLKVDKDGDIHNELFTPQSKRSQAETQSIEHGPVINSCSVVFLLDGSAPFQVSFKDSYPIELIVISEARIIAMNACRLGLKSLKVICNHRINELACTHNLLDHISFSKVKTLKCDHGVVDPRKFVNTNTELLIY
jgi:hypothetical protein